MQEGDSTYGKITGVGLQMWDSSFSVTTRSLYFLKLHIENNRKNLSSSIDISYLFHSSKDNC